MWNKIKTKNSNMTNRSISHSLKEWNLNNNERERTFEISESVLIQLHLSHNFSKKKKVMFMLSASKNLGAI